MADETPQWITIRRGPSAAPATAGGNSSWGTAVPVEGPAGTGTQAIQGGSTQPQANQAMDWGQAVPVEPQAKGAASSPGAAPSPPATMGVPSSPALAGGTSSEEPPLPPNVLASAGNIGAAPTTPIRPTPPFMESVAEGFLRGAGPEPIGFSEQTRQQYPIATNVLKYPEAMAETLGRAPGGIVGAAAGAGANLWDRLAQSVNAKAGSQVLPSGPDVMEKNIREGIGLGEAGMVASSMPEVRGFKPEMPAARPTEPAPKMEPVAPADRSSPQFTPDFTNYLKRKGYRDLRHEGDIPEWHGKVQGVVDDLARSFGFEGKTPLVISGKNKTRNGSFLQSGANENYIFMNDALDEQQAMATMAHEFGHALIEKKLAKEPLEVQQAIDRAVARNQRNINKNDPTLGQIRPLTSYGKGGEDIKVSSFAPKYERYFKSKDEYLAEQVSRWVTTDKRATTLVEKFFKNAADTWRKIYEKITGHTPLDSELREFIEGHWREDIAARLRGEGVSETKMADKMFDEVRTGLRATKAGQTIEAIFSPTTMSGKSREAEASIRKEQGTAARDTARTEAALEEHQRIVANMDDQQRINFISYVEGDKNIQLSAEQKELADKIAAAYRERRTALEGLERMEDMNFIDNYFVHLWQDEDKARSLFGSGGTKEGRVGFTKGRKIPTIKEGIDMGLTPKTLDPIEATMQYIENADKFIATERVFEQAREVGTIKYYQPGKQPDGWVKVEGRLGRKGTMDAYAPQDWARVYNNFVSKGITGPWKNVYDAAQQASNMVTAFELGLSGYHALNIAVESFVNQMAKAVGFTKEGKIPQAAKAAGSAFTAPVSLAMTGRKMERVYLGLTKGSEAMERITQLLTEAGGRAVKGTKYTEGEYAFSKNGDFYKAWKRGALKSQMLADLETIKGAPFLGTTKVVAQNLGRVMSTVAAPLFEKYIPLIKNGAFYENMAAWLENNPSATYEEQVAAARERWDSVDNRFGEVVKDNIFWDKTMKQVAQLAMLSYSWNLGTVREIGGGLKDIASRKWSPRVEYVIGLAITNAIINSIYQYAKTGKAPESLQDLKAPQTGGTNSDGTPERITPFGYMKDVYGYLDDPLGEIANKVNPAFRLGGRLLTNRDWKTDPIAPPASQYNPAYQNVLLGIEYYLKNVADSITPISIKQFGKVSSQSNISMAEQLLGIRPAGMKYTNPEKLEQIRRYMEQKAWQQKLKHDITEQRKYQGVDK